MKKDLIFEEIKKKRSFLCVGLDVDLKKIPNHLLNESDPIFSFCKSIIDYTAEFSIAFKINIAFFESHGSKGWKSLEKVINYISNEYPDIFTIADAKRGDIGNSSYQYAKGFFETLSFDSITVSPYMGEDSIEPFLNFKDKFAILLALTSNKGANDFQFFYSNQNPLFKEVIDISKKWKNSERLMYVVGATKTSFLKEIRKIIPDSFILIPGIGAQGGDLIEVSKNGLNNKCGIIVNSSRKIIYSDSGKKFAESARLEAKKIQIVMEKQLKIKGII
ncbi:MAG: orotidine-5'-phosphate decarboxylase [Flavobacteriaceae bacterium]|nr:orotidine-5'-phosphate decarboxylase [Flavobacteriaceae bacterium]|tara:strand:+ start:2475 stop:3302 length:828 start_codon:yes stop_codon:yes gene_type:complete